MIDRRRGSENGDEEEEMAKKKASSSQGLNRGAWTSNEDRLLSDYIVANGPGKWNGLSIKAGLNRSGKSCRLRWLNYLRPDIKRGNISLEEEDLIIRLQKLLGNKWSWIAGRLPRRTDNEIKNYWNTYLKKKLTGRHSPEPQDGGGEGQQGPSMEEEGSGVNAAIRTKAVRCIRPTLYTEQIAGSSAVAEDSVADSRTILNWDMIDFGDDELEAPATYLMPSPSWDFMCDSGGGEGEDVSLL